MTFKLLIECSKDIDELHINFADGTCSTSESTISNNSTNNSSNNSNNSTNKVYNKNNKQKTNYNKKKSNNDFLDLDYNRNDNVSNEIIEKPIIKMQDREINVAPEVQNLEI